MWNKFKKIVLILLVVLITVGGIIAIFKNKNKEELQTIKTEEQLLSFYNRENNNKSKAITKILALPLYGLESFFYSFDNSVLTRGEIVNKATDIYDISEPASIAAESIDSISETGAASSSSKDYSTTNIQVENVDEADITKTDGDYIYSISENQVVITNVKNPQKPVIATKINGINSSYPEDIILYNNKLVVISQNTTQNRNYYYSRYSSNQNTLVSIYDITIKENPILKKNFELYEPYYTSRCINNRLYVISSGKLRKENDKIIRKYKEDQQDKEIELNNIKYLKELFTDSQTLFSTVDLDNTEKEISVKSYLMDISNAYVSENSFYLLDEKYESSYSKPKVKDLFGIGGVIGFFHKMYSYDTNYNYDESGYKTEIYKFNIKSNGNVEYRAKTKIKGKTINQYSLDEKNGHLRVALYENKGSSVAIFDENLEKIGETEKLAKGENMYSSRFIGDKAYLVTYRTIDPLWVIDLSNEKNPKVLGELSIPGYSTYLHPYDENHLIGIGMETKETTMRDSFGKVISTSARIVGMKMALFDVSNVRNPKQISSTIIGDSRTTSAILTNPKALLFSKEKQLIAIPVNHYAEDFEVADTSKSYQTAISSYKNKSTGYIGEGYLVYKLNLEEGFKYKGLINHEKENTGENNRLYYYYNTKMLRGLYIDNNLYTISETKLKINNLDDLKQISELKIKGE